MLAYLMMKTSRNLKCKLDRALKDDGITSSQFSVMNYMESVGNETAAHEIAEALGYDRPTVSAMINRLYKNKFIEKNQKPTDKRMQYLSLTTEGLSTLYALRKTADDLSDEIFGHLTQIEKETLIKTLNLINDKLEATNG